MRNSDPRFVARVANAVELQEGLVLARAKRDLPPAKRFLAFREIKRQFQELTKDNLGELGADLLASAHTLVKQRRAKRREMAQNYRRAKAKGFV